MTDPDGIRGTMLGKLADVPSRALPAEEEIRPVAASVAVVIPSRNQVRTIRRCLDSVRSQTLTPRDVIVVDSSDNETTDIIRDEYPDVVLIHLGHLTGTGEARNIGAAATDAEVLSFTDTDCAPRPGWLEAALRALASTKASGVVGSVSGPPGESWVSGLDRSMQFSGFEATREGRWAEIGPGCNLTLRRKMLENVGGFPTTPRAQDVLLCRRYVAKHGLLWFEPAAAVTHLSPDDMDTVVKRQFTQGTGHVQSRVVDPGLPGSTVLRWPALAWPLAAVRCLRIGARLALHDRHLLAIWMSHPSAVVQCFANWTSGVHSVLREIRRDSD